MAIDDYKITNAEVQAAHVQAAPNTLTGTAQENKAVFDGYPELLKEKHNNLIDAIDDALSEKADSSDVEAALAEKADSDDVDTALAEKVDKIEGKGLSANDYIDADKALVGMVTNKVDKETGKGLSTNDYTTAEKMKLSGIAAGAEVNVQADWEQSNSDADDYINNKPYIPNKTSDLTNDSNYATETYVENGLDGKVDKETGKGLSANDYIDADKALVGMVTNKVDKETGKGLSTNDYTTAEKMKLSGIAAGAEVNVQSDWSQNNSSADDYIKNKPTLPSKTSDLTNDSDYTTKEYVDGKLPIGKASGTIASVKDGADGMPMKSLTANIVPKQAGSGTPSPDNVREISGWESVSVNVAGENLFNKNNYNSINAYIGNGKITANSIHKVVFVKCKPLTRYTISRPRTSDNERFGFGCAKEYPADGVSVYNYTNVSDLGTVGELMSCSINTTADAQYLVLWAWWSLTNVTEAENTLMITEGTSTDYKPFNGHTHSTDLGRTVYGGTVDVVSGVLTVDRAMVDLGSLTWTYQANYQRFTTSGSCQDVAKPPNNNTQTGAISSVYVESTSNMTANPNYDKTFGISDSGSVQIRDEAYTDATALQTSLIGQTMVYFLATPTTIQLTPQQIDTLLGLNNVWADSGDVTIEYIRDIGLALDNLLPDSPTTDGTYTLVCTVSDGKATIAWQSSGASLSSPLSMSSPTVLNSTNDTETRKVSLTEEEGDSNEIR